MKVQLKNGDGDARGERHASLSLAACVMFALEKRMGAAKSIVRNHVVVSVYKWRRAYVESESSRVERDRTEWNMMEQSGTKSLFTNGGGAT